MKFLLPFALCLTLISCKDPGTTTIRMSGEEAELPPELKGLKVYTVWFNSVGYVNVAVLDGKVNSTTHQNGKFQETTVILNHRNTTSIRVKEILSSRRLPIEVYQYLAILKCLELFLCIAGLLA